MPLFSPSSSPLSVDVPPYRIYVAPIQRGTDPKADPTWGQFQEEKRLKVLAWTEGSSVAGISRAKLSLAVGAPLTSPSTIRVEDFDVLHQGDRVVIAQGRGTAVVLKWAGYMVRARIHVEADREGIQFELAGPEWLIGGRLGAGTWRCVCGQLRRDGQGDDHYFDLSWPTTDYPHVFAFTDDRAVFNPGGHQNRTKDKVNLTAKQAPDSSGNAPAQLQGYVWEIPDRKVYKSSSQFVAWWTKLDAVQTLWTWYNDPAVSGIQQPDWDAAKAVLESIDTDMTLRDVDVEGLSLWEATRKILGPQYGCFITPLPVNTDNPNQPKWDGFKLQFFARGTGPAATVTLNPLGTPAAAATPGVVRLEAMKDITKTANRVRVFGKRVRHIRLMYWGADTATKYGPDTSQANRNIALQHGWKQSEGDLTQWAVNNSQTGQKEVDRWGSDSLSSTLLQQWNDQFCSTGPKFEQYKNVFRLFVWNEAGEFSSANGGSDGPAYGPTPKQQNWWVPNLSGIADDTGAETPQGNYCRRRRPLLDTQYFDNSLDGWRRVPPTLYLSAMYTPAGGGDPQQGPWVEVSRGHYRVDPDRGGVWITVADLADWRPLDHLPDPAEPTVNDLRTFGTLLNSGDLRMMVEASIETDYAMEELAERSDVSGSPFVREMVIRRPADFVQSLAYSDGLTSPAGMTGSPVDTSADATALARQTQAALQDQETHASILLSADAARVDIGSMLSQTGGRKINFAADGTGTKGSQVVALECDPLNNKIQVLTESDLLRLGRRRRRHAAQARKQVSRRAPALPGVPRGPDGQSSFSGDGPAAPGAGGLA